MTYFFWLMDLCLISEHGGQSVPVVQVLDGFYRPQNDEQVEDYLDANYEEDDRFLLALILRGGAIHLKQVM